MDHTPKIDPTAKFALTIELPSSGSKATCRPGAHARVVQAQSRDGQPAYGDAVSHNSSHRTLRPGWLGAWAHSEIHGSVLAVCPTMYPRPGNGTISGCSSLLAACTALHSASREKIRRSASTSTCSGASTRRRCAAASASKHGAWCLRAHLALPGQSMYAPKVHETAMHHLFHAGKDLALGVAAAHCANQSSRICAAHGPRAWGRSCTWCVNTAAHSATECPRKVLALGRY